MTGGIVVAAIIAAGGWGLWSAFRPPDRATGRLNVLLVTLDTTRCDHLGCYNPDMRELTPNLNDFAADAAQFLTCVSQSAATPPSHASILTGLNPFQHGLRVIYAKSGCRLPDTIPYLPAVLKDAGWTTAAFLSSFTVSEFYGFDRAFDTFDSGLRHKPSEVWYTKDDNVQHWSIVDNQRRSDHTTDAAIQWLQTTDKKQPFFLWVHYWDPHEAYTWAPQTLPPIEFLRPYLTDPDAHPDAARKDLYRADVAYVDQQFGRLIQAFKDAGQYDNTIIAVVADHGEGLGEHDWWFHRLLYQEQVHLPLLLRVPGWPTGRKVSALVRAIDIYPTVLDALAIAPPAPSAGISLRGLIHNQPEAPRLAYADALNRFDFNSRLANDRPKDGNLYCITDGTWKLIWRLDYPDESELYNLADDPDEMKDLFHNADAEVQRLRRALETLAPFRTEPFPDLGDPTDQGTIDRLTSMGYLDTNGADDANTNTNRT